jgi:hypothetical protein
MICPPFFAACLALFRGSHIHTHTPTDCEVGTSAPVSSSFATSALRPEPLRIDAQMEGNVDGAIGPILQVYSASSLPYYLPF